MLVQIDDIIVDETVYPRNVVNQFAILRMVSALEIGSTFPPAVIEVGTNRLVDGRHRIEAHRRRGLDQIDAEAKSYISDADLFADAVRLNIGHGTALSNYDVRRAVARLIEMGWAREQISEAVRLPPVQIESIVKGFAQSIEGASVPLKGGLLHKRAEIMAPHQIAAVKRYGGGKASFYANQIISLLDHDLWPRESAAFRDAMDKLVELWAKTEQEAAA